MRILAIVPILMAAGVMAGGCSWSNARPAGLGAPVTAAALFDRQRGAPPTREMAVRSDWPAAQAFVGHGESVYYRERFSDIQSTGFSTRGWGDRSYRRFESIREGSGRR
ncbi:MAG: hypothetical protein GY842_12865 [bacterium]|nr:hypothetical protein [bacterium]